MWGQSISLGERGRGERIELGSRSEALFPLCTAFLAHGHVCTLGSHALRRSKGLEPQPGRGEALDCALIVLNAIALVVSCAHRANFFESLATNDTGA
jgi:hypothetical protein